MPRSKPASAPGLLSTLRSTQRAPKSCKSCSSRKTKCDKKLPCSACISRGAAATCARETVVVRGVVTRASDRKLTYLELEKENARLKQSLQHSQPLDISQTKGNADAQSLYDDDDDDLDIDRCENILFFQSHQNSHPRLVRGGIPCIQLPSRECSRAIVKHGQLWNSWVHFALDQSKFEAEHELFWGTLGHGGTIDEQDPLWLATYFSFMTAALLIMDANEIESSGLQPDDQERLLHNWYNAAIHFLYRADFMRSLDIRTVQAIAILGMCFANFGDTNLYMIMWSCAIRIGQTLGLDKLGKLNCTCLSRVHSSRLWWTLVICEWMGPIDHPPCVSEADFDVPLSTLIDEAECYTHDQDSVYPYTGLSAVSYHIAMAQIATIYHRFRANVRSQTHRLFDLVRNADEQLAGLISELPSHLQPDEIRTAETDLRDIQYPWIPWQQFGIRLVLLYHRLSINRHLQPEWLKVPEVYQGQRAICLDSAKAIVDITSHWDLSMARRRQWALSAHVFAAGTCLILESKGARDEHHGSWEDEVKHCMGFLDQIKSQSVIAEQAMRIMSRLMAKTLGGTRSSRYDESG